MTFPTAWSPLVTLASVALVVAALRFGRDLLMPLFLAVLLVFVLDPLVSRVQRLGLPRALSVAAVSLALLLSLGLAAWLATGEVMRISSELPNLRANVVEKARSLRGPLRSVGEATGWVDELSREVQAAPKATPKVEIVESPNAFRLVASLVSPVLAPLAIVATTFILMVFLLIEHEAFHARVGRFVGSRELPMTARALDEATERVASYLARQAVLCGIHGVAVALGLALIGVPGAIVCGVVAGALRLLPYLGPWIGAAAPTLLAAAALPGWTGALHVILFLVALEIIQNNVLEPWIYSRGIGLSPFGVVFSAVFWAWLWGIPGLVLAVPLTVCLVVLARHVPQLSLVTVFLGDEPVLPEEARFYQSLICRESDRAAALLREVGKSRTLLELSDGVVLPALARLAEDRERGSSSRTRIAEIVAELSELLADVPAEPGERSAIREPRRVRIAAARRDLVEDCAARWIAHVLRAHGVDVRLVALPSLLATVGEDEVVSVISALRPGSAALALARPIEGDAPPPGAIVLLAAFAGERIPPAEPHFAVVRSCAELAAHLGADASAAASTKEEDAEAPSVAGASATPVRG